jgi:hypothetical protein
MKKKTEFPCSEHYAEFRDTFPEDWQNEQHTYYSNYCCDLCWVHILNKSLRLGMQLHLVDRKTAETVKLDMGPDTKSN